MERKPNPYQSPRLEEPPAHTEGGQRGMRVKIFTKMNPKNKVEPVNSEWESEINNWLADHPHIVIRHIQQSAGAGSMGPFLFCITIWYDVSESV